MPFRLHFALPRGLLWRQCIILSGLLFWVVRALKGPSVGSSMWRLFRLREAKAAFLLKGGSRQFLGFWVESLHPGGVRRHIGGRLRKNFRESFY